MTAPHAAPIAIPIDPRISTVVAGIAAAIPEAQVRLFGSRAKGTARPDSDVALLITVPDPWLTTHDRTSRGPKLSCLVMLNLSIT
ncbi:nucleotidyltransferase domain-containing protein [Cyanobium sp. FGCU-6]|nr:nucleotidyltransferase domain-containing protein [Cyanobium sp. FGCU6]